jgi:hypothetical protein
MSIKAKMDLTFWARECSRHPEKAVLPQMAIKYAETRGERSSLTWQTSYSDIHAPWEVMTVHDFR